jgi:hypothetical protein
MDEQELIQSPEALLALVQQAVQHLIEQRPDTAEQEAQLRAVAKAIEQLEKQRVPVPDSLRQTKMDLVAKIDQKNQFDQQLRILGKGLAEALEMIEEEIGKPSSEGKTQKESTPRQRRPRNSDQPATPQSVLEGYIIQALKDLGGSARSSDVIAKMREVLKDRLTPRDLETLRDGRAIVWVNSTQWARQKLVSV